MDSYHGVHDEPERSLGNPTAQGPCHQEVETVGRPLRRVRRIMSVPMAMVV
jgi:hypothetical protein